MAVDGDFDFWFNAGDLRGLRGGDALVFGLFTWFAAFRRVLQPFVVEKLLLADSPDEILTAIATVYRNVGKFSFIRVHLD